MSMVFQKLLCCLLRRWQNAALALEIEVSAIKYIPEARKWLDQWAWGFEEAITSFRRYATTCGYCPRVGVNAGVTMDEAFPLLIR